MTLWKTDSDKSINQIEENLVWTVLILFFYFLDHANVKLLNVFNVYVKQKTLWLKLNDFFSD